MEDRELTSRRITSALVQHLAAIFEACGGAAVFIYSDALGCQEIPLPPALAAKTYYICRSGSTPRVEDPNRIIRIPNVNLTRIGLVKMGVFLTWSQGVVRRGDTVVCVTGASDSGRLDTIVVTEVGVGTEGLTTHGEERLPVDVMPQVIERVIDIAAELGSEGREGKPVGALFVVGDTARVIRLSKQMIINPFRGYPAEERNLLDPNLEETTKELSAIDGAFIVAGDGVIVTCGSLLKTGPQQIECPLPHGLGARHHAAAGITAVTDAIAVTVSESTGTVTVFRHGQIVTEIEKPRNPRRREF